MLKFCSSVHLIQIIAVYDFSNNKVEQKTDNLKSFKTGRKWVIALFEVLVAVFSNKNLIHMKMESEKNLNVEFLILFAVLVLSTSKSRYFNHLVNFFYDTTLVQLTSD